MSTSCARVYIRIHLLLLSSALFGFSSFSFFVSLARGSHTTAFFKLVAAHRAESRVLVTTTDRAISNSQARMSEQSRRARYSPHNLLLTVWISRRTQCSREMWDRVETLLNVITLEMAVNDDKCPNGSWTFHWEANGSSDCEFEPPSGRPFSLRPSVVQRRDEDRRAASDWIVLPFSSIKSMSEEIRFWAARFRRISSQRYFYQALFWTSWMAFRWLLAPNLRKLRLFEFERILWAAVERRFWESARVILAAAGLTGEENLRYFMHKMLAGISMERHSGPTMPIMWCQHKRRVHHFAICQSRQSNEIFQEFTRLKALVKVWEFDYPGGQKAMDHGWQIHTNRTQNQSESPRQIVICWYERNTCIGRQSIYTE